MRVLFFGTPDYTQDYLDGIAAGHDVCGVVTAPDRAAGRGLARKSPAPARWARERGIPLFQPEKPGDPAFAAAVRELSADAGLIIAYGKIIPASVYTLPAAGCFNLHFSLLPRWRGASPIESALLAGDSTSGLTLQRITAELDAGDILLAREIPVPEEWHYPELFAALLAAGKPLLEEGLTLIARGDGTLTPQEPSRITHCGKITTAARMINWDRPRAEVLGMIRAFSGHRTALTRLHGMSLCIHRAALPPVTATAAPGTILTCDKTGLLVACQDGPLAILELQKENRKKMDARSFLNGNPVTPGDRFAAADPETPAYSTPSPNKECSLS